METSQAIFKFNKLLREHNDNQSLKILSKWGYNNWSVRLDIMKPEPPEWKYIFWFSISSWDPWPPIYKLSL
jgi:hypothetical protein